MSEVENSGTKFPIGYNYPYVPRVKLGVCRMFLTRLPKRRAGPEKHIHFSGR